MPQKDRIRRCHGDSQSEDAAAAAVFTVSMGTRHVGRRRCRRRRGPFVGRMELDGRGSRALMLAMKEEEEEEGGEGGPLRGPPREEKGGVPGGSPEEEEEKETLLVELPPCCQEPHGAPLGEMAVVTRPKDQEETPPAPLPPPRGRCLLGNWQEERATNPLDRVPCPELGPEAFFFRGGHRGLLSLTPQEGLGSTSTSTTHDAFRTPRRTALPDRGKREAMMEWLLYQKHSKEVFEQQVQAAPGPMESQSTTHRDYCQEGFVSVPPAPTKPHDYRLEQPQTFWRENAQRVTGVSCIRTGDTPFRKCAAFTTPTAEYLEQPYDQETYPNF